VEPARRPDTARSALSRLNALQYVDWRRTSGAGLLGQWVGTWPPHKFLRDAGTIASMRMK
jgi:eukaryotic-like serine/threonine-protein kinase